MSEPAPPENLQTTYLRLRSDVTIEPLPVDAAFWPRLARGELGTFHNEYLVTVHESVADWSHWERHPLGDEIVCLLSGTAVLVLEQPGGLRRTRLDAPGQFVLVPRGIWHTAQVGAACRLLFITAGEGTEHRPIS